MRVRCLLNSNYPELTVGKEYEVKELIPRLHTTNFTFPRYVSVINDWGSVSTGHAYRFETLEGICCEEYIKDNIRDTYDTDY